MHAGPPGRERPARRTCAVTIGTEHPTTGEWDASIVTAPFKVGDATLGTIGVVGPTRMDYLSAMASVRAVAKPALGARHGARRVAHGGGPRPLRDPRCRDATRRRRHQGGVSHARARAPPGRERGDPRRRSGSRRSWAPTRSCRIRQKRRRTTTFGRRADPRARRSTTSRTSSTCSSAAASASAVDVGPRVEGPPRRGPLDPRVADVHRVGVRRAAGAGARATGAVRDVPGQRRAPGNVARRVPDVSWDRRGPERAPEHLRDRDDGVAVRDVRRARGRRSPTSARRAAVATVACARAPTVTVDVPAGVARRDGAPRRRSGERRRRGRPDRRPLRRHRGGAVARRSTATDRICTRVLDVSITQATLGGDVEVETLDGAGATADRGRDGVRDRPPAQGQGGAEPAAPRPRRPVRDAARRDADTPVEGGALAAASDWPSCVVRVRVATAAWHGTFAGRSSALNEYRP